MFSHTTHVMTLANSIIGVGILAMPFCFQKCGIILSIVLIIVSNWITRLCCHYLIKCSLLTRRKSIELLGFHAFGSSGKLLVELCIIGYLLGTCITYFVVVGDLGPQIVTKMLSLDENGTIDLRTLFMVVVTLLCILPLGMLKNVDSLAMVCTASIGFYVCLVLKIVFESRTHIEGNDWSSKVLYWEPAGVLQCLPIFSMALSCQMQIFEVFETVNNQSIEKLNGIVKNAVWTCTFVYIAMGLFGYVAFCHLTFSGNILMNFSPSFGSDVIKIGFILSVAFSFPLVIFPCRASIYSLLYRKGHADAIGYIPDSRFKSITVFIVCFSLVLALMIPSIELIIGLVGSTIGVAICVMFPASCFRKIFKKDTNERKLAQLIIICGFCFMILGTYASLSAIDQQSSGAHLQAQNVEDKVSINPTIKDGIGIAKDIPNISVNKPVEIINSERQNDDKLKSVNDAVMKLKMIRENKKRTPTKSAAQMKPPPLPVDEQHVEEEQQPVPIKVEKKVDLAMKAAAPIAVEIAETVKTAPEAVQVLPKVVESAVEVAPKAVGAAPAASSPTLNIAATAPVAADLAPSKINEQIQIQEKSAQAQLQTINQDAIKNEEQITNEEKQKTKEAEKTKDDELKELKKAKELIQETVDQLKEELARKTVETQNLVVEKLSEVKEKVEEIERQVQSKEKKKPLKVENIEENVKNVEKVEIIETENKILKNEINTNNSLLTKLAKGANVRKSMKSKVYEPLSYKTGELIEKSKIDNKLEHRLPLPLALLINASYTQMNETPEKSVAAAVAAAPAQAQKTPEKSVASAAVSPAAQNSLMIPTKQNLMPAIDTKKETDAAKKINEHKQIQQENVDAIRRDLLQHLSNGISTLPNVKDETINRMKRSVDFEEIQTKLEKNNCLLEPKEETLMSHGRSSALDLKMNGIGRKLKSVKEVKCK